MAGWTSDELGKIGAADELRIESVRRDGTFRKPVRIWVVRLGGDLYVRSVKGRTGPWFRGTRTRHEGRIRAGGIKKDVTIEDAGDDVNDKVDAAYRRKYRSHDARIVDTVLTPQARASTTRLRPRS